MGAGEGGVDRTSGAREHLCNVYLQHSTEPSGKIKVGGAAGAAQLGLGLAAGQNVAGIGIITFVGVFFNREK